MQLLLRNACIIREVFFAFNDILVLKIIPVLIIYLLNKMEFSCGFSYSSVKILVLVYNFVIRGIKVQNCKLNQA